MAEPSGLRMALTGDSLIARRISVYQDDSTQRLLEILRESDVAFTNLESLPNNFQGYPVEDSGGSHLGAHAWVIDELLAAGINLFAMPNNHSLNFGVTGLLALIDILEDRDLAWAGIGRNLGEARMPAYLDTSAGSVALVACASTFGKGQQASVQRPDMPGRPGVNPLRYSTTYVVPEEDLTALRRIATNLGLEDRRLERIKLGFGFPPSSDDIFPFLDNNFRAGTDTRIETSPNERDLDEIVAWVQEAAGRADLVVASIHAHEQGASKEEPAEFLRAFARRVIEAGADVVVGHGPHLIRGVELIDGKPVFYSLGNFVGQNELTYKLPSDSYETFRVDPVMTPGRVYSQRSEGDTKGFPADRRYWETIVPVCEWDGKTLERITVYPVSLGHGEPPHRRGRPRLATGAEATGILNRFQVLSEPYGTHVVIEGESAVIRPDDGPRR